MDNPINDPQPAFVRASTIGPRGPEGVRGVAGERGSQGPQGVRGPDGEQGPRGVTGAPGRTGPDGLRGAVGQPVYWDDILLAFAQNYDKNDEMAAVLHDQLDAFYEDFKHLIIILGGGSFVGTMWYLLRAFVY